MKEVRRFLKVQTQTVWAPAVTTLLFLIIFSVALGRGGREVLGVPFASFVAPGLIVMGMMQNAFANSSFSLLSGKIQGTIIDLLMPPLSEGELMTGIVRRGHHARVWPWAGRWRLRWRYGPGVSLSAGCAMGNRMVRLDGHHDAVADGSDDHLSGRKSSITMR